MGPRDGDEKRGVGGDGKREVERQKVFGGLSSDERESIGLKGSCILGHH